MPRAELMAVFSKTEGVKFSLPGGRPGFSRRDFLRGSLGCFLSLRLAEKGGGVLPPGGIGEDAGTFRFEPEYSRGLQEVLVVYDQVAADYLFQEVLEILSCLHPERKVHFLCSLGKKDEARRRLKEHNLEAHLLACDAEKLWGDWGRDIFFVGWRGGKKVLFVPYTKTATSRGELTRGFEVLRSLWAAELEVRLVPLSFEGGNMTYDRVDGRRVLFLGNSALLDTAALYRSWFHEKLNGGDCLELFRRSFSVDQVIPLGRVEDGAPRRQAAFFFHIDLACAIVAEGVVAVEEFEVPSSTSELREEIREEMELNLRDENERKRTEELLARKGIRGKLPRNPEDFKEALRQTLEAELARLREGKEELKAIRKIFRGLGYRIHDLPTHWRRVRRTQSYANVLLSRDRIIIPIFPPPGTGRARTVFLPEGRHIVEVLRHPRPDEYRMDGWNRENYRLYRSLSRNVRVLKDAFYLAGGNIHCVLGAIG